MYQHDAIKEIYSVNAIVTVGSFGHILHVPPASTAPPTAVDTSKETLIFGETIPTV